MVVADKQPDRLMIFRRVQRVLAHHLVAEVLTEVGREHVEQNVSTPPLFNRPAHVKQGLLSVSPALVYDNRLLALHL